MHAWCVLGGLIVLDGHCCHVCLCAYTLCFALIMKGPYILKWLQLLSALHGKGTLSELPVDLNFEDCVLVNREVMTESSILDCLTLTGGPGHHG